MKNSKFVPLFRVSIRLIIGLLALVTGLSRTPTLPGSNTGDSQPVFPDFATTAFAQGDCGGDSGDGGDYCGFGCYGDCGDYYGFLEGDC
jgi:hypothetical protein